MEFKIAQLALYFVNGRQILREVEVWSVKRRRIALVKAIEIEVVKR